MRIIEVEQGTQEWLELRKNRIMGSKLNDIVIRRGSTQKMTFYELIADGLGLDDGTEDGMNRGHDTEVEAINAFAKKYNKKVITDCGIWISDVDEGIGVSPDAGIKNKKGIYTEAVETKCLSSSRHIQAIIDNWPEPDGKPKEPVLGNEYEMQALQYFIVNEDLKKLYFCFYDPRITARPLLVLEIERDYFKDDIKHYTDYQLKTLAEVKTWVERLAF